MSPEGAAAAETIVALNDPRGPDKSHHKVDDRLTPTQRIELHAWLENNEETYKSAGARLFSEWGVEGVSERMLRSWHQRRKVVLAKMNLAEQAEAARELVLAKSDAECVEDAVVAQLINRSMEVVTAPKITPSHYREVVGLVVRLREQNITKERLRLEKARFELDVAEMVLKHIEKLKASGALQLEDRGEAAKRIREELFGRYTIEEKEAAALSVA